MYIKYINLGNKAHSSLLLVGHTFGLQMMKTLPLVFYKNKYPSNKKNDHHKNCCRDDYRQYCCMARVVFICFCCKK